VDERGACTTSLTFAFTVASRSFMNSSFDRRPYGGDQRLDMRRRLAFGGDCFLCRLDRATALIAEHYDKTPAQMIDCIFRAAEAGVVDHIACHSPRPRLTDSGETRTPSVKLSANMNDHVRTNNPVRMAINDENKDFMALMGT
jgi:hypothetical protein